MSRSPTGSRQLSPSEQYLEAWQELAKKIRKGWSFSGHERNCCFLNTRGERFADVSAAIGLDHIDDSRAVALSDWDRDGDVDLWIANRTGPRVRFLRNDVPAQHHFVSLRLRGDPNHKCNRDAIGARVEVYLGGGDKRIQTLYAGDGYLSQSSKWLHFGLGKQDAIEKVVVRWPGSGERETFLDVTADRHWTLVQGTGTATRESNRAVTLRHEVARGRPLSDRGRVWLDQPLEANHLVYQDFDGNRRPVEDLAAAPTLINLWATWCQPCLTELNDLSKNQQEIRRSGLSILALHVPSEQSSEPLDPANIRTVLTGLDFPLTPGGGAAIDGQESFSSGLADVALLEALDKLQEQAIYRRRPLPLPASFLLDAQRRLVACYFGPVSVSQLMADVGKLAENSDPKRRRDFAVPFPGRWSSDQFISHPVAVASVYIEGDYLADARDYLQTWLRKNPVPASAEDIEAARTRNLQIADVHYHLGRIARLAGQPAEAVASFQTALKFNASVPAVYSDLAGALASLGRRDEAVRLLRDAPRRNPNDPRMANELGALLQQQGKFDEAIEQFQAAIRIDEQFLPALNNLAWLLATCHNAQYRDGRRALELADKACKLQDYRNPATLDALAAAYAETGRFDEAVRTIQRAVRLAKGNQQEKLALVLQGRLPFYSQKRPFREGPPGQ